MKKAPFHDEKGRDDRVSQGSHLIFALRQDLAPVVPFSGDRLLWLRRAFPSTTLDKTAIQLGRSIME
jgi:hypothetical protein